MHALIAAQRLGKHMIERLGCVGFTLWNSTGAGQVVPHFHIHVIPRYEGDEPVDVRPREHPEPDELASVARLLE